MRQPADSDYPIDWDLTTWEGSRREQLRRWAALPLDRTIAALEEMAELAEALRRACPATKPAKRGSTHGLEVGENLSAGVTEVKSESSKKGTIAKREEGEDVEADESDQGRRTKTNDAAWPSRSPPLKMQDDQGFRFALDLAIAKDFRERLAQRYDLSRFQVKLYGSRARGDADRESDLDLFVALDDDDPSGRVTAAAQDIATDLTLDHGILISVFVADATFLRRHQGYSFLAAVEEEGIPL